MKKLFALIMLLSCAVCEAHELDNMTLREKVGQLFVIRPDQLDTRLTDDEIHKSSAPGVKSLNKTMTATLKEYPAGGFAIFGKNIADPKQLRKFVNDLKKSCAILPIMAIDEEGGRISRIANHKNFRVRKFASVQAMTNAHEAGSIIGAYLRDYGFNMDFAPVADINTNPDNIVIGDRAFGSDPAEVSRKVSEFLDGLHQHGIAGSIKHFPGHGDTTDDTHTGYVAVSKTWDELLRAEIIPFRDNLKKADSVMISHITMKNVTSDNLPATLSHELVTGKLRGELGYDGVVVCDALMMGAIKDNYSSAEAAVMAIEAGCDILLMSWDYREAFDGVIEAVKSGRISEQRINESVMRILKLKDKMNSLKWWQKSAVYQVYPKSFLDTNGTGTGDIKGITSRLDYLHDLGVGAIWLTPVYPSPMIDNGYDIADYTGIDKSFGSMNDFDELIREADKRGIKIVMDLVFNHCSSSHAWFQESRKSRDNEKSDWFIWRDKPTNWRSIFGGSAWEYCEERGQYYLHTFAKEQPDLNWENPDVRRALYDAANFWLDKGVGGFRIDAITYIKKPAEFLDGTPDGKDGTVNVHTMTANTPGILDFLHEFRREVFDGRDIFTVGEANGVSPDELSEWVGERGVFDMLFEFSHVTLPLGDAEIWCYPAEWKLTDLKRALTATQTATKNSWCPVFFENHDQPRSVNHFFPEGVDTQKAAKVLGAVLLTMRGTPFIYQGEELGMSNREWRNIDELNDIQTKGQYNFALNEGFSPEEAMKFVRYFTRDNARTPMQWTSGTNAGFSEGGKKSWLPVNENYTEINAANEAEDDGSVLSWYKKLMTLRKSHEELIAGDYEELFRESEEIFAFVRGGKFITVANFSQNTVTLPDEFRDRKILLDSEENDNTLELSPLEVRIYM